MADEDTRLMVLIAESKTDDFPYPFADVYGFSISYLYELSVANEVSTFLAWRTDTRTNSNGTWVQCGESETLMHPTLNEVLGSVTPFRFIHAAGTPTSWIVKEYCLDDGYKARHNIPSQPVEFIGCKLQFVSQQVVEIDSSSDSDVVEIDPSSVSNVVESDSSSDSDVGEIDPSSDSDESE